MIVYSLVILAYKTKVGFICLLLVKLNILLRTPSCASKMLYASSGGIKGTSMG